MSHSLSNKEKYDDDDKNNNNTKFDFYFFFLSHTYLFIPLKKIMSIKKINK